MKQGFQAALALALVKVQQVQFGVVFGVEKVLGSVDTFGRAAASENLVFIERLAVLDFIKARATYIHI